MKTRNGHEAVVAACEELCRLLPPAPVRGYTFGDVPQDFDLNKVAGWDLAYVVEWVLEACRLAGHFVGVNLSVYYRILDRRNSLHEIWFGLEEGIWTKYVEERRSAEGWQKVHRLASKWSLGLVGKVWDMPSLPVQPIPHPDAPRSASIDFGSEERRRDLERLVKEGLLRRIDGDGEKGWYAPTDLLIQRIMNAQTAAA